jgi:hypothetical protein
MPLSIEDIRDGLATNLATISGLRTSGDVPDNPNPPQAVVFLETVDYDEAFQGGLTTLMFKVMVIVSRADDRTAQRKLNEYISPDGAQSIKSAVESDRSLGGLVSTLRLTTMTSLGSTIVSEQEYMAVEFSVAVYA